MAALAARLGCLPWRTPGPESVLQRLHGGSLEDQVRVALLSAAQPHAADPAFLDVAAGLAGVTPAWTGGPLTWLWTEQDAFVAGFDAEARAAWAMLEPALRRSFA